MDQQNYLILITAGFNIALLALLICGLHFRAMRRARRFELLHRERMLAMEKGIPLPELPHLEESVRAWPDRAVSSDPRWALIWGVISVSLGSGYMAAALTIKDMRQFWSLGLIPTILGAGLLVLFGLLRHGRQ